MKPEEKEIVTIEANKSLENLYTPNGATTPCQAIAMGYIFTESADALNRMLAHGGHQSSYNGSNGVTVVFGAGLPPKERANLAAQDMLATQIIAAIKNSTPDQTPSKGIIVLTSNHLDDARVVRISKETGKNVLFGKGNTKDPSLQMHAQVDANGNFLLEGSEGIHLGSPYGVTKYGDQLLINQAGNQIELLRHLENAINIASDKAFIVSQHQKNIEKLTNQFHEMLNSSQLYGTDTVNTKTGELVGALLDYLHYITGQEVNRDTIKYGYAEKKAKDATALRPIETRRLEIKKNIAASYLEQKIRSLQKLETKPYQETLETIANLEKKKEPELPINCETFKQAFATVPLADKKKELFRTVEGLIDFMTMLKDILDLHVYQDNMENIKEYTAIIATLKMQIETSLVVLESGPKAKALLDLFLENLDLGFEVGRNEYNKLKNSLDTIHAENPPISPLDQIFLETIPLSKLNLERSKANHALRLARKVQENANKRATQLQQKALVVAPIPKPINESRGKEDILATLKETLRQAQMNWREKQETFETTQTPSSYREATQAQKEMNSLKNKMEIIEGAPPCVKDLEAYWAAIVLVEASQKFDLISSIKSQYEYEATHNASEKIDPKAAAFELESLHQSLKEAQQELQEAEERLNTLEGLIPNKTQQQSQDSGQEIRNHSWTTSQLTRRAGPQATQVTQVTQVTKMSNRRNRKGSIRR